MTTDFRNVLGTVIEGWMGGGASTVLNGSFENLGFFQTGPGDPPPTGGLPPLITVPSSPTEFVSMNPQRLFDTRDGTGDHLGALGGGQMLDLQVAGRGGVSDSPEAVALNVTGYAASATTSLTVYPYGAARPATRSFTSTIPTASPPRPSWAPWPMRGQLVRR